MGRRLGRFVIRGSMDDADVLHVSSARRVVLASSVRLTHDGSLEFNIKMRLWSHGGFTHRITHHAITVGRVVSRDDP